MNRLQVPDPIQEEEKFYEEENQSSKGLLTPPSPEKDKKVARKRLKTVMY